MRVQLVKLSGISFCMWYTEFNCRVLVVGYQRASISSIFEIPFSNDMQNPLMLLIGGEIKHIENVICTWWHMVTLYFSVLKINYSIYNGHMNATTNAHTYGKLIGGFE